MRRPRLLKEPTDSNRARPPTCLWSKEFYDTISRAGLSRLWYSVRPARRALCSRLSERQKGHFAVGRGSITASSASSMGHRIGVSAICEDLPEEHNRVTLDPDLEGIATAYPRRGSIYTISENSRKMIGAWTGAWPEVLEAAGAPTICTNNPIPWGGWHLARQQTRGVAPTPAASVVNEWGRAHDVKKPVHRPMAACSSPRVASTQPPPFGHCALRRRSDEEPPRPICSIE